MPSPAAPRGPVACTTVKRLVIIGCGGSGKTLLANQLAALYELPLTHLDAVYYDAEWNPLPTEEFEAEQRRLVAEQRWLIEGNYAGTLPIRLARAETVIFLDLPPITCLYGIAQRRWRYRGGQHGDGVYDHITWNFIKYIWGYRKTMRPKVQGLLAEHGGNAHLHMLTSRRQAARYVRALQAEQSTRT